MMMRMENLRATLLGMALLSGALTAPAEAHEDPREMGAGAEAVAQHQEPAGHDDAAADHHDEGSMMEDTSHDEMAEEMGHSKNREMRHDHGADNSDKSFGEHLFIWLGKLHVAVIHFPIALIVAAFGAEAFGAIRNRPNWRSAARIMLVLGALGAAVAAALGWFAGGFYLLDRNLVLTTHRYLGMVIAIGSASLAWAGLRKLHHERRDDMLFAGLLGVLTIGVLLQAFLGGTFMHGGLNHMNF